MSKVAGADGDGDDVAAAGRVAGETGVRHAALLWRRAVDCGRQGAPVALAACAAFLFNHPCLSLPSCPWQCMQGACLWHLLQPVLHGHRGLDTAQQVHPAKWSAPGSLGLWSSEPGHVSISDRPVLRKQG